MAERPHLLALGMAAYTDTGVLGRPSLGSADKGKAVASLRASFRGHLEVLAVS